MGRITNYSLDVLRPDLPSAEQVIANLRSAIDQVAYAIDEQGATAEGCTWYEHEADMLVFSRRYPEFVFVLRGKGEETEDMWIKYFKDGKVQVAQAKIEFEAFDPDKLK